MYKIKINYSSGDSFNRYDNLERCLEPEWTNIEIAKENLKRIKDHYDWITNFDPSSSRGRFGDCLTEDEEEEYKKLSYRKRSEYLEKIFFKRSPSFVKIDKKQDLHDATYYINLLDDNRNEIKVCAFWNGYFEILHGASIVTDEEDGWSFTL